MLNSKHSWLEEVDVFEKVCSLFSNICGNGYVAYISVDGFRLVINMSNGKKT